jgi:hypothetical protein
MDKTTELALAACRAALLWAAKPGPHGGNPYSKPHVKAAERAIAEAEGREPEDWARGPEYWEARRQERCQPERKAKT